MSNIRIGLVSLCLASFASAQTVAISGRVLTLTGAPIPGATCQFKSISNKAVTDAEGRYSFSGAVGLKPAAGYGVAMAAEGRSISLRLDQAAEVSLDLYSLSGRLVRSLPGKRLNAGAHDLDFAAPADARQVYLLRVTLDGQAAWHKVNLQGGAAISTAGEVPAYAMRKSAAAADSLFCTEPNHHGGLGKINGRTVTAMTGTQDFRMVSSDKGWDACAPPFTFAFDQSAGALYYQKLVAGPQATNQEVLREVCQSIWKTPADIPANRKFTTYKANINSSVSTGVASTGGNSLNFNVGYINDQKGRGDYNAWYEIVGVLVHEGVHSYQPYYSTAGASGFGEAIPDAIRALTGFFRWPTGSKCTGSYAANYQEGGKYWYFIEQKHPGFINKIFKLTAGDISTRVQTVTGQSLTALVSECQTKGMP